MPSTTTSARILHRYLSATRRKTAAVVLRDCPRGWDWGWVIGSEPPMHVIPMMAGSRQLGRVDLEDREGRRIFRPEGRIPNNVLNVLATEVAMHSIEIEDAWCHHMVGQAWITPEVDPQNGGVDVTLYGGTANERTRAIKVNWPKIIGPRKPAQADVEIDGEAAEFIVGAREARPIRVPLSLIVFGGRVLIGDGVAVSDAGGDPWQRARARRIADRYVGNFVPTRA
ncbi:MAG: hypothetical protein JW751_14310 [Polyangiaceae bacterium]|nr:hypothetical protein [Polyangiaceae bacterium]